MIAGLGKVRGYSQHCSFRYTYIPLCIIAQNRYQCFKLLCISSLVKAAELVTANLVRDESHLLDVRLYLEQRLLVSPISLLILSLYFGACIP